VEREALGQQQQQLGQQGHQQQQQGRRQERRRCKPPWLVLRRWVQTASCQRRC
jgi:hypothetical protein